MTTASSKSASPFTQQHQWNRHFEDSYLPKFYEQDVQQPQRTTFRSLSPKIYNQPKIGYFSEPDDELDLVDNEDSLYEATLMKADFLSSLSPAVPEEKSASSLSRLRQILDHINPNYASEPLALSEAPLAASVRSQFSAASSSSLFQQQQQTTATTIRLFSISEPKGKGKGKGKGKLKTTL